MLVYWFDITEQLYYYYNREIYLPFNYKAQNPVKTTSKLEKIFLERQKKDV